MEWDRDKKPASITDRGRFFLLLCAAVHGLSPPSTKVSLAKWQKIDYNMVTKSF